MSITHFIMKSSRSTQWVLCALALLIAAAAVSFWNDRADQVALKGIGRDELMNAITSANESAVRQRLSSGSNVNARDSAGLTPLMLACGAGYPTSEKSNTIHPLPAAENLSVLGLLLASGAHVAAKSRDGSTALDACIFHGRTKSVKSLLGAGASVVTAPNETGGPLALAVTHCYPDIVELLLKEGADPNALVDHKTSAREYAIRRNCQSVIELLDKSGLTRSGSFVLPAYAHQISPLL
jgi:ankyrin repeat protein